MRVKPSFGNAVFRGYQTLCNMQRVGMQNTQILLSGFGNKYKNIVFVVIQYAAKIRLDAVGWVETKMYMYAVP